MDCGSDAGEYSGAPAVQQLSDVAHVLVRRALGQVRRV